LEKHNELIVQIGKNGINEASITEIKTHLKRRKDVKVKFLQSFIADKDRKKVKDAEKQRKLRRKVLSKIKDSKNKDYTDKIKDLISEEQRELHKGGVSGTGYPKSTGSHRLIYSNQKLNLEEIYYWILTQLQMDGGFRKDEIFKVTDIFSSSEMSTYWGVSSQRLGIQQDKASGFLRGISDMVKSMFQLIRDLGIIDEKIGYYKSSFSKNEKEMLDGEQVLKGQFVDLVEGGTQNPSSVFGLGQKVGFTLLPDIFFRTQVPVKEDTPDDEIGEKVRTVVEERIRGKIANKQFQDVLERKLSQYYRWKQRTYKQLKVNRNVFKSYLKQHFNTIKLYMTWIRPYLINVKRLTTNQGMADSPDLISAFEGNMIEIEVVAAKESKPGSGAYSCILANFQYRTHPHLDYVPNYQQNRASMVGRVEMNLKSFGWTKNQLDNYLAMKEEEDWDSLKDIMGGIQEGMDSLKDEVLKYLNEDKEEEKEEKEKVKAPSFFQPITDLHKDVKSIFKMNKPKPKPDVKGAGIGAKKGLFPLYHYYKKASRLLAW